VGVGGGGPNNVYTHVSKCKNDKIKLFKKTGKNLLFQNSTLLDCRTDENHVAQGPLNVELGIVLHIADIHAH
jgi:hypothetical protein